MRERAQVYEKERELCIYVIEREFIHEREREIVDMSKNDVKTITPIRCLIVTTQ